MQDLLTVSQLWVSIVVSTIGDLFALGNCEALYSRRDLCDATLYYTKTSGMLCLEHDSVHFHPNVSHYQKKCHDNELEPSTWERHVIIV